MKLTKDNITPVTIEDGNNVSADDDEMSGLITTLFESAGNGKYRSIQVYHTCGGKLYGVMHRGKTTLLSPPVYYDLMCSGCDWPHGLTEREALKEIESAWLEFAKA